MIKATVYFGNNNMFTLQLGLGTVCGDLINLAPMAIGKTYKDVAYCICNGQLVGSDMCHMDRPLIDLVLNGECVIHLILNVTKEPLDNIIRYRYGMWIIKKNFGLFFSANQDPTAAANVHPGGFVDVPVVIPRSELSRYIEDTVCTEEDMTCGICSLDIPVSSECSSINVCNHMFHTPCITRWLTESNVKCPMCNADVRII